MKNEVTDDDFDYAAYKRVIVKELFWVYQRGELNKYIRIKARRLTRLAVRNKEVNGNVLDVQGIISHIAWIRDTASKATPSGDMLAYTRADIEAYHHNINDGPMDWNRFFGLDKVK